MKFANFQGQRSEAEPGRTPATCLSCGAAVIAKCGDHRVWHWAHRGARLCDQWWEPETEWHRNWKNEFPAGWQEVIHYAPDGEKHVSDIKTPSGTVIEFQHSFIRGEERMAREAFYRKMVWVVDGRRRKRDASQLLKCIGPCLFARQPFILHSTNHEECALLRDWNDSPMPVYFDLGVREEDGSPIFWRRDPISRNGRVYLTPVSRESFLTVHREGLDAEENFSEGIGIIAESLRRVHQQSHPLPPAGFQQYRAKAGRFRRRF